MFAVETMTRQEQRQILRGQCHSTSRNIMQCLQNKVKSPRDSNPIDSKLNKLNKILMLHMSHGRGQNSYISTKISSLIVIIQKKC